jgi:1-acyl-sn-glycerol-3-phosphate acyltransferase
MVFPVLKTAVFPIFRLYLKKTIGLENLPKKGPFIITANHESYVDPFLIAATVIPKLDRKIHYLANRGLWWSRFGDRIATKWAGCVPNDNGKEKEIIEKLTVFLKRGGIVGIFPEGGRIDDGLMRRGKTGAVRLALRTSSPIVPIGIMGSYKVAPGRQMIPNFKRAQIRIGKPIYFDKYYGKEVSKKVLYELIDQVMVEISKLAKKKYDRST